jgi:uncharacterized membrane protein
MNGAYKLTIGILAYAVTIANLAIVEAIQADHAAILLFSAAIASSIGFILGIEEGWEEDKGTPQKEVVTVYVSRE